MPKAKLITSDSGKWEQVWIYCPGCKNHHALTIKSPNNYCWNFNNDFERPTFTPSLLCNKDYPEARCHSFITDGKIQFLDDCFHELKNQTVDLPEIDL